MSSRGKLVVRLFAAFFLTALIGLGTAQAQGVLDNIKRTGVLRAGIATTQPGAFKDINTDEWTGINAEVAKRLAELMGVEIVFVETSWDLFLPALNSGEFDIYMPGTFYTIARAMQAQFSDPAYYKGVSAVVDATNDLFTSVEDLNAPGVRIAVRLGAVEANLAPRLFPEAEILEYRTDEAATIAEAVRVGNADVWIADEVLQSQYLEGNPWATRLGDAFGQSPISYVLRYGDPDWLYFVNNYIRYMRSSGEMSALLERFGQSTSTLDY